MLGTPRMLGRRTARALSSNSMRDSTRHFNMSSSLMMLSDDCLAIVARNLEARRHRAWLAACCKRCTHAARTRRALWWDFGDAAVHLNGGAGLAFVTTNVHVLSWTSVSLMGSFAGVLALRGLRRLSLTEPDPSHAPLVHEAKNLEIFFATLVAPGTTFRFPPSLTSVCVEFAYRPAAGSIDLAPWFPSPMPHLRLVQIQGPRVLGAPAHFQRSCHIINEMDV